MAAGSPWRKSRSRFASGLSLVLSSTYRSTTSTAAGSMPQDRRSRRQGIEQVGELDDQGRPGARQLDQPELGLDRHAERSLRSHQEPGQVECRASPLVRSLAVSGDKRVEVVPSHAPENLRETPVDLPGVLGGQPAGDPVARAFEILAGTTRLELRLRERTRDRPGCRRRARPSARAHGRSSCRRGPIGRPRSCWRSCRRSSLDWTWRCPGRTGGRAA